MEIEEGRSLLRAALAMESPQAIARAMSAVRRESPLALCDEACLALFLEGAARVSLAGSLGAAWGAASVAELLPRGGAVERALAELGVGEKEEADKVAETAEAAMRFSRAL